MQTRTGTSPETLPRGYRPRVAEAIHQVLRVLDQLPGGASGHLASLCAKIDRVQDPAPLERQLLSYLSSQGIGRDDASRRCRAAAQHATEAVRKFPDQSARCAADSLALDDRLADELLRVLVRHESLHHVGLVWLKANRMSEHYPDSSAEQLLGFGYRGLLRALELYDPAKHAFSTYAMFRIDGFIRDGLRMDARVPKRAGTLMRKVDAANEVLLQNLARRPTAQEVADQVDIDLAKLAALRRLRYPARLDDLLSEGQDPSADDAVDTSVIRQATAKAVQDAVAALPDGTRDVARTVFLEGQSIRQASATLGIPAPQVRRLRQDAAGQLRSSLEAWSDLS